MNNLFGNNTGWICPRCAKVHAPFIPSCNCSGSNVPFNPLTPMCNTGGIQLDGTSEINLPDSENKND